MESRFEVPSNDFEAVLLVLVVEWAILSGRREMYFFLGNQG